MIVVIRWWTLGVCVLCIVQQRVFGYERSLSLSEKKWVGKLLSEKWFKTRHWSHRGILFACWLTCKVDGICRCRILLFEWSGIPTGRNMTSNSHEEKLESRAGVHQIRTVPSLASRKKRKCSHQYIGHGQGFHMALVLQGGYKIGTLSIGETKE